MRGPEEKDPAGEGKGGGGRGLGGGGVGGARRLRRRRVQGAADGGGAQEEIEDAGEETAEDEREAERVDGEEMVDDGVCWAGALGGVGVGQEMPEGVERVEGPERERGGEQEQTGDEGCEFGGRGWIAGKTAPLGEQRKKEERGEEDHLRPQERRDAGEQAGGEEGFCGGLRARGGEDGKEGEARGGEGLHSGEDPVAGVGIDDDEEQKGGGEERGVGAEGSIARRGGGRRRRGR